MHCYENKNPNKHKQGSRTDKQDPYFNGFWVCFAPSKVLELSTDGHKKVVGPYNIHSVETLWWSSESWKTSFFFSSESAVLFLGCFTKNINLTIRNCDRKKIEKCVLISMLQYSWVSCSGLSNVYIDKNIYIFDNFEIHHFCLIFVIVIYFYFKNSV